MGKTTVKFKCHSCGHCCTEVVCLPTPWDVIRLAKDVGVDPREFIEFVAPEEIDEVNKSDPAWLICGGKRYMMALRRNKNGCFFRDRKTRYCWAYESRPILCRLYPLALNETRKGKYKSFTLHKNVGCPRHRDGLVDTKPMYDLYREDCEHQDDYHDLVEFFNNSDSPGRKPEDFIDLFIVRKKKSKKSQREPAG